MTLSIESFQDYDSDDFTATYSAEDDKLRIYTDVRFERDEWQFISRTLKFKHAPKQELLVAHWSVDAEDFCMTLAGSIEPEEMSLADRAEFKAERLAGYSLKRANDSNVYRSRADQLSQRFAYGQPILIGHHSEKSARRDQAKMENAMRSSIKCNELSEYWAYRAKGVINHANHKNSDRTRVNRIERLAKELRDHQKVLNASYEIFGLWRDIAGMDDTEKRHKMIRYYNGAYIENVNVGFYRNGKSSYWMLEHGDIEIDEIPAMAEEDHKKELENPRRHRVINHLLNRLAYERDILGTVSRYDEKLTPAIIQKFLRYHGADKPKAVKTETGFDVTVKAPLPLHIGDGLELSLSDSEWRDMMASYGYDVVAKIPEKGSRALPLLNLDVTEIVDSQNNYYKVERMKRSEYASICRDYKGTRFSACGGFRFRVATTGSMGYGLSAVFIVDSKAHDVPASMVKKAEKEGV